jgi:hypothetical protein
MYVCTLCTCVWGPYLLSLFALRNVLHALARACVFVYVRMNFMCGKCTGLAFCLDTILLSPDCR